MRGDGAVRFIFRHAIPEQLPYIWAFPRKMEMRSLPILCLPALYFSLLTSCSSPTGSSSEPFYLSRVTRNSQVMTAYQYNPDKTVSQITNYDTTGKVTGVSRYTYLTTYTYANGKPVSSTFASSDTSSPSQSNHFTFDSLGGLAIDTMYLHTSDTLAGTIVYSYGPNHQLAKEVVFNSNDSEEYWIGFSYTGSDITAERFYAANDTLVGTVFHTEGTQHNPYSFLSSQLINFGPHVTTSVSSLSTPDSLGRVTFHGNKIVVSSTANGTFSTAYGVIFSLYSSTFTYNVQGWPLTEVQSIPSKYPSTDTLRYEYLSD